MRSVECAFTEIGVSVKGEVHLVVGDSYEAFAHWPGVVTVSRFRELSASGQLRPAVSGVVLGQGIGVQARAELAPVAVSGDDSGPAHTQLASLTLTHKRNPQNVLIASLREQPNGHFHTEVIVNELADRLCDHVTGQHLSGMLLFEAARQGVVAALELRYQVDGQRRWSTTWSSAKVDFLGFVFPLSIAMAIEISEPTGVGSKSKRRVDVHVSCTQLGKVVVDILFAIELVSAQSLAALEAKLARKAAASVVGDATEQSSVPTEQAVAY